MGSILFGQLAFLFCVVVVARLLLEDKGQVLRHLLGVLDLRDNLLIRDLFVALQDKGLAARKIGI